MVNRHGGGTGVGHVEVSSEKGSGSSSSPRGELPSQRDLEREVSEYLTKKYGGRVRVVSQMVFPRQLKADRSDERKGQATEQGASVAFNMKPEELEAYLDRYVVRQETAKAVLATKVCTHFNRINYLRQKGMDAHPLGNIKNNIILLGPTGVGKTFIVKLIAAKLKVPFVKGDATKFSETGYVGGDVEDLIRDLVEEADGDLERAQYGIVYIDEIDKIAAPYQTHGPDVSRAGVQRALLKPMEETEVDLRVPHDPISQLEAIERYRRSGKREKQTLSTRHVLFILSGAFAGLAEIVKRRLCRKGIGFGAEIDIQDDWKWLRYVKPQDLIEYGFESEFVGRIPVIAPLDELAEGDLLLILKNPNSSVIISKKQDFRAYGIDLKFDDEALRQLARQAYQEGTGARALVSAVERALLPFEKRLPSVGVTFLVVTKRMIDDPEGGLARLLAEPDDPSRRREYEALVAEEREALVCRLEREDLLHWEAEAVAASAQRLKLVAHLALQEDLSVQQAGEKVLFWIQQIRSYEASFFNRCGLRITFDDAAVDAILLESATGETSLYAHCERLCNILEYGLGLLRDKTGADDFTIPVEAVNNPELYINRMIRSCYREDVEGMKR